MKHLHKFKLKNLSRDPKKEPYYVYACVKPDCTTYIRLELIDGKQAECFRCGEPFIVKLNKIKNGKAILQKLHCEDCTWDRGKKSKKKEVKEVVDNLDIDDLLSSILPK